MYLLLVTLLNPLILLMLAIGLLVVRLWLSPLAPRRLTRSLLVLYVLLYIIATPAAAWLAAGLLEWQFTPLTARPADPQAGIVVLGTSSRQPDPGRAYPWPDHAGLDRCRRAADLYRAGPPCPVVIAAGRVSEPPDMESPAASMRRALLEMGVAESDLLLDEHSRDTDENARNAAQLLRDHHLQAAIVCTDATHLPRAAACFRRQQLTVYPAGCRYRTARFPPLYRAFLPHTEALAVQSEVLHELIGFAWYFIRGRI